MNNRLAAREPVGCDPVLVESIEFELGCSALAARALIRRGVSSAEEAQRFLYPQESELIDPFLLPDMKCAAERVKRAVDSGERICVFGDYDADGVCATAMLFKRLKSLGANADYYIPHRHSEGYGMSQDAVRRLHEQGVSLIVTVDNGVSAFDEIALCGALGIDVVVTDHHSVGKTVPDCAAVVAATRRDSIYPNRHLCGAGVALKLIQAVCGSYSQEELALAAVATIADVVPLSGENRTLVSLGIRRMQEIPGIAALMKAASCFSARPDETTVSFIIAPRLNAAGRMADATEAVRLLTSADEANMDELSRKLNDCNQRRRDTESEILEEAERQIEAEERTGHVLLLAHEGWNAGVIGIVASRLCEKYHLPVILFAGQNGVLTGSGRSIEGVDLFENLSVFSHLFIRFGGHARAAGVTIAKERFEEFTALFRAHIEANYQPEDFYPSFSYDEPVLLNELSLERVKELRRLAPFGEGNPEPVFRINNVRFSSLRTIGKDEQHFCASAVQHDQVMRVVAFGKSELLDPLGTALDWDLLARPSVNEYRGSENVELIWICANASEEKVAFFNAFFTQRLYNGDCSDGRIDDWYSKYPGYGTPSLTDSAMRKHYRALQDVIGENGSALISVIRSLRSEELMALCVFSQLSFFGYNPETGVIRQNVNPAVRALNESALYRLANNGQEA